MTVLDAPIVFERGEKLFLVGPVQVHQPNDEEIAEYAFAEKLKQQAPNPHLVWLRGQYVEADIPNLNGHMWTAEELRIKSLTPMFMPVTVMHDPRTAVGVIADAKLMTPDADGIPRSKIETVLGLWSHRFPEATEEALENAKLGTLMQSMECLAPDYACSVCGMNFHKLPGGAEQLSWCAHLKGEEGSNASRILGNVVFTGTGLIYGTWDAKGADPKAHLEVFQEEVAQHHDLWHEAANHQKTSPRKRRTRQMDIEQSEYDRLKAAEAQVPVLEEKVATAEKDVETAEAAKVKAEGERDAAKTEKDEAEEKARRSELRDERWGALGEGFIAKLGDKTSAKLKEQAGTMSDEEWKPRVEEVSELVGVASDAKKDEKEEDPEKPDEGKDGEFTAEEIARAEFGSAPAPTAAEAPSGSKRRSVVAGL